MSHPRNYFFLEPQWPRSDSEKSQAVDKSLKEEVIVKEQCRSEEEHISAKIDHPLIDLSIKTIYSPEVIDRLSIKEQQQDQPAAGLKLTCSNENHSSNSNGNSQEIENKYGKQIKRVKLEAGSFYEVNDSNELFGLSHSKIKEKYNILDRRTKEFLVQQTKFMSITQVSRIYGVSINNLCRWKKTCERRAGAGRKVTNMEMEKTLIEWIQKQQANNVGGILSRKQIQEKAKQLAHSKMFKASKGWFQRFAKRNSYLGLMDRSDSQHKFVLNSISRPMAIEMIRASIFHMRTRFSKQPTIQNSPIAKKNQSE